MPDLVRSSGPKVLSVLKIDCAPLERLPYFTLIR